MDNVNSPAVKQALTQALQERDKAMEEQLQVKFRGAEASIDELSARLLAVEQKSVRTRGASNALAGGASPGASFMRKAQDDASFSHLKAWNQGAATRMVLPEAIKSLVNFGSGDVGDTEWATQPARSGIAPEVFRPLRLLEVLPSRPIGSDAVEYIQMTSTGDAAEQVLEGDTKAEVDFSGTAVTANVATIAAWTSASKQVLDDHAALTALIDRTLRYKTSSRLEHQIINGAGGTGKINGLLNQATAFTPTLATTPADKIGESLTAQSELGYQPSLVVINPSDWFKILIERSATDGQYLFGSPIRPIAPSIWNANVVASNSIAAGSVLTIDTAFVTLLDRMAPSVMVSNSHSDFFVRNLVAILAELRAALEIYDAKAVNLVNIAA